VESDILHDQERNHYGQPREHSRTLLPEAAMESSKTQHLVEVLNPGQCLESGPNASSFAQDFIKGRGNLSDQESVSLSPLSIEGPSIQYANAVIKPDWEYHGEEMTVTTLCSAALMISQVHRHFCLYAPSLEWNG
jgi:hypothetical protein